MLAEMMGFVLLLILVGLFALFAVPVGVLLLWVVRRTSAAQAGPEPVSVSARQPSWRERSTFPPAGRR